ncbi:helix-turn-helix domain-containing protein [Lactobacillus helveticus]|uniref:helix-turn-helix domain-containing protein n=1 Tax=Lactobacillus helveticus TaxID=1587 RepID=UPI00156474D5|nr:Rgg/GadR/MutR family transcriptional regulator [Lactobacillus helveticus]NRO36006.1 hypothetical protein [Lactobacillus helveticus]
MTIGEALKKERKDLGLTQAEFVSGVITTAHYSKIERDKHDISAYDLFKILTKNKISFTDFIKEIKNQYESDSSNNLDLNLELVHAFYRLDRSKVKKLNIKIKESNASEEQKLRAILIEANVTNTIDDIPKSSQKKIKRILFENENWLDDELTLRLFCNSMLIFSPNELNFYMNDLLNKYSKDLIQEDFQYQKLVASICVNFLYIESSRDKLKYNSQVFSILEKLPEMPEFFFYKTLHNYYLALLNDDKQKSDSIKNFMSHNGLPNFSKILPK